MATVPINDKWRIASDPHCWRVEEYRGKRKDGAIRWEPVTFHTTFENALVSLFDERVRRIDSSDPQEIVELIKSIRDELLDSVRVFKLAV